MRTANITVIIFMGLFSFIFGCSKQDSTLTIFPKDENGDVLRRMQAGGDDLSKPRDIIFQFVFPTEQKAKDFAEQVRAAHGLKTDASRYEERKMWQAEVTKTNMLPTHQGITALEQALTRLAQSCGGEADGWGCFQVDKVK